MRLPSNPEALENKPVANDSVSRDPSYPDRARIDSDVRAFLRPVSTPWIVFDRDSRCDDFAKSALRVGAVFASSPSFRPEVIKAAEESGRSLLEVAAMPLPGLAPPEPQIVREDAFRAGAVLTPAMSSVLPDTGVFPPQAGSPESVVEPSNLVVATDVMTDSSSVAIHDGRSGFDSESFAAPAFVSRGRLAAIAGACAGVLALVGVTAVVLTGTARTHATAASTQAVQANAALAAAQPPPPAETVELDDIPAPPPPVEPPAVTTNEPAAAAAKIPTDPKKRFGKLTIKADARHKNVWFDGKRMLGSGQRSFLVFCGMHTVAVTDKSDTRDIEIPCNGEYAISK